MEEYLRLAKTIALEAGDIMLEHFGLSTEHQFKNDHSPFTQADLKINGFVIDRLAEAYPEHSFVGEEGQKLSDSNHVWVFDPIDGTIPYLRGIPTNVFSIALVVDGEPVLGVVYDPYMKRLYHAVKGGGAFLNDKPISVRSSASFENGCIEVSGLNQLLNNHLFDELRASNVRLLSFSSTIYAHMLVATGQIEGVIFSRPNPWDCASAKVIVEEAGGVVSNLVGGTQRYDKPVTGFISAANRDILDKLVEISHGSYKESV